MEGKTDVGSDRDSPHPVDSHAHQNVGAWERQREVDEDLLRQRCEQDAQAADLQHVVCLAEAEETKKEERKKYKNKYGEIPNRLFLAMALLFPAQHTLTKLRKGDYAPLYHCMNKGICEAEKDGSRDEDLLMLVQTDKGPTFQTSASVKAKKHKIKDESLTWEEFGQANY